MFCSDIRIYHTVSSSTHKLSKLAYRIDSYGKNSIIISATDCSNEIQNMLGAKSRKFIYPTKSKNVITKEKVVEDCIRIDDTSS